MDLTKDEQLIVRLRGCFTGGYTLPQCCIDNNIKRPLFVSEKKFELFLWEVYVQFHYDNRLLARFCFIDSDDTNLLFNIHRAVDGKLTIKNISNFNLNDFDKIILLTLKNVKLDAGKTVCLPDLGKFFSQRTFIDIPLLNFLQRYPQVKLILTNFPSMSRYKNSEGYEEFNAQLWSADELLKALRTGKNVKSPFDRFGYTSEEIIALVKVEKKKKCSDGSVMLSDDNHPLLRIKNGKRETAYQPEHYNNKIYFFGPCHHYGTNAPFDKTIESYLQKMLNENGLPYRVENESQHFAWRYQDVFYNLNKMDPAPGDIIFFWNVGLKSNNDVIPFCDISDAFDPPNDYKEVYCRTGHVNEIGYKLVAEKYFKYLTENNFFRDIKFNYPPPPVPYFHRFGIPPQFEQGSIEPSVSEELESYKQSLRAKRLSIGALVMNCNPFTLGHRYLVEYAAAKVVKLYIFVVEEDKSEFPFADRIELVRQGVKGLPNVEVLPSGKFIISQTTFSGYFNKAELQDVQVDSSEDVEIFGQEIAPTLGITVRFAGEEPKDNVTRQYNETMKRILPRYGVEFYEIPRKEFDGEPISASSVRAALKVGDFDKIKNLVPDTTFLYLRERYSSKK